MFVVSHPGSFKYRTRKMVREAYEDRFRVSEKQRSRLDKWAAQFRAQDNTDDEEATRDNYDGSNYDSDYDSNSS